MFTSWTSAKKEEEKKPPPSDVLTKLSHIQNVGRNDIIAFTLGAAVATVAAGLRFRYLRRIPNADWVTPDIYLKKRWVKGIVTSVGDADNFRLYHTPGLGWWGLLKFRSIPKDSKALKDNTIHIRMAGIDAPESGYFGKPAQKYAEEAKAWLKDKIEGRKIYCQLVARDQYKRIIAIPVLPSRFLPGFLAPRLGQCVSLEMLKAGWATTYEQSGAEYGKWGKEFFLAVEQKAKRAKKGQWKYGTSHESPADFKKRIARAQNDDTSDSKNTAKKLSLFRSQ